MLKTKILIADDNDELRLVFEKAIKKEKDFELVGAAEDGVEAYNLIVSKKPDVVLLDLIMPNLDGIGVLEKLKENGNMPLCIVFSAVGEQKITRQVMELGAKYYLVKPIEEKIVIQRIRQFIKMEKEIEKDEVIFEEIKNINLNFIPEKNFSIHIEFAVSNILQKIGMPVHIRGYFYVRDAIVMGVRSPEILSQVTKQLYPELAKKYKVSTSKIERAIRNSIDIAWTNKNSSIIKKIFTYNESYKNRNKPTNSEFIATISDKIRMGFNLL